VHWGRAAIATGLVVISSVVGSVGSLPARGQSATPAATPCPVTTPDENKALVQAYFDAVYNEKDPAAAERFLADDFTRNNFSRPQANEPGNADDVQRAAENLADFPDLHITVDQLIGDDDMVSARLTWSGTQRDAIDQWHAPATGKPASFAFMAFYRVACGKLAEQWVVLDYLSMLRQLGIISDDELATIGSAASPVAVSTTAPAPAATPLLVQTAPTPAPPTRPRVFVGSSVEGLPIAEAIALDLQYFAEVTIWSQGTFHLSQGTLVGLDQAADSTDFAIMVLTADDTTVRRGKSYPTTRDNVIFELGFFMGRLGPTRTYMVYDRGNAPTLPTDLAGVTAATFAQHADGNLEASVGPAATALKEAMQAEIAGEQNEVAPAS
jgi:steroid delta-isomerase-like uncharacterized protein